MSNKHVIYVYGTLRQGNLPLHPVPGKMYNLGCYPGIILHRPEDGEDEVPVFFAERIVVDDTMLARLDQYEGYHEGQPKRSLYLRQPYKDGWIYEWNSESPENCYIPSGNWLKHLRTERGTAYRMLEKFVKAAPEDDQLPWETPFNESQEESTPYVDPEVCFDDNEKE